MSKSAPAESGSIAASPEITESLTYPISPDYVKGWTIDRAVGELVANAIDEDLSFTFDYDKATSTLRIEDQGNGVPAEGLVLGMSSKSDRQIGQFGEGLQIATIVLARSKSIKSVRVESVGYGFIPTLTTDSPVKVAAKDGSKVRLLRYDFFESERTSGTKVEIVCPEKVALAARSRFLHFEKGYEQPEAPGRLIVPKEDERGGRIYIGGVLVQDNPDLYFNYDLALSSAKGLQNRDRTEISGWRLDSLCQEVRSSCEDPLFIRTWAELALAGALSEAESRMSFTPTQKRSLRAFKDELFEGRAVCFAGAHDDSESELGLKDEGYEIIKASARTNAWIFADLMRAMGIHSTGDLSKRPDQRKARKTDWIPDSKLTDSERHNLEEGVRIVRGLWGAEAIDKYAAYEKTSLEGVGENTAAGFYQPQGGKIGIQRRVLSDFFETVSILTHEAAHRLRHRSGSGRWDYGDRTRGFESQLEMMAASSAMRLYEAGLVPEAEAIASQKDQSGPGGRPPLMAAALLQGAMKQKGLGSARALANDSGVSLHKTRNAVSGRTAPSPIDIEAICQTLDLAWEPVYLALASETYGPGGNYSASEHPYRLPRPLTRRRTTPRLYGVRYTEFEKALEGLRALGARERERALGSSGRGPSGSLPIAEKIEALAEAIAEDCERLPDADSDWLAPYRELVLLSLRS